MVFLYVRLRRKKTKSWLTYKLSKPLTEDELTEYFEKELPGWIWETACNTVGEND
jgi:hypothetical protein